MSSAAPCRRPLTLSRSLSPPDFSVYQEMLPGVQLDDVSPNSSVRTASLDGEGHARFCLAEAQS